MGCLKKITNMIIFAALIFAFFAYGGYTFVKNKYDAYTKPERNILVEEEKDFGNLSDVSADYVLSRSLNLFGYRKLNALYVPKNQKITILDLNSSDIINEDDFEEGNIEEKLENFSSKIINSPVIPVQNIEIKETGKIKAGSEFVPYADFEAEVKMAPIFKVKGTIAVYATKNNNFISKIKNKVQNKENITSKLILAVRLFAEYDDKPVKKLISEIEL